MNDDGDSKESRKHDFYRMYKNLKRDMPRKESLPSPKVEIPKNEYDRRDKSWLHKNEEDVDETWDGEMDRELGPEEKEHFNLDEWNKKFNATPIKKSKK